MSEPLILLYSAAGPSASLALRSGGVDAVRDALIRVRETTLRQAHEWRAALGNSLEVPYATERNPPVWELGHVAWFQEWWVARNRQRNRGHRAEPDHERLPSLLARADALYDSGRVAHSSRWSLDLPDFDGTLDYLVRTHAQTMDALDDLDASPVDAAADSLYFFRLVALHEAMHAEAGDYMARGLDVDRELSTPVMDGCDAQLPLAARDWTMGRASPGFAFDNERGEHVVRIEAGAIDARPVSWSRYLPFVEAGGYEDREWWTEAGREWLAQSRARAPRYLRREKRTWQVRRGGSWQAVRADEAAMNLTCHEAEAWCRWAGRALPTEAQWECAALTLPDFRWGAVWEWTATPFDPYPGFVPHPYRDYSAPWFGSRRVLRGASAATSPLLAHVHYRNFFEPQRCDVFAGFRSIGRADAPVAV